MLDQFPLHAALAAQDARRAREWYEAKLDLTPDQESEGSLWYRLGEGTWLHVYETPSAGTAQNTVAGFTVQGIESLMDELRRPGVVFEQYDMPNRENGLASFETAKSAWFKDSEGNILELSEPLAGRGAS
jgi:catechol 2,3-dioxygenase-like lactoylglutathione lyase family enzyme